MERDGPLAALWPVARAGAAFLTHERETRREASVILVIPHGATDDDDAAALTAWAERARCIRRDRIVATGTEAGEDYHHRMMHHQCFAAHRVPSTIPRPWGGVGSRTGREGLLCSMPALMTRCPRPCSPAARRDARRPRSGPRGAAAGGLALSGPAQATATGALGGGTGGRGVSGERGFREGSGSLRLCRRCGPKDGGQAP